MSGNLTAAVAVLSGLALVVFGVWAVFGIGWAAIIGGLIAILLGFGFAYDAVASSTKAEK